MKRNDRKVGVVERYGRRIQEETAKCAKAEESTQYLCGFRLLDDGVVEWGFKDIKMAGREFR